MPKKRKRPPMGGRMLRSSAFLGQAAMVRSKATRGMSDRVSPISDSSLSLFRLKSRRMSLQSRQDRKKRMT
jgi:hypothetical protein